MFLSLWCFHYDVLIPWYISDIIYCCRSRQNDSIKRPHRNNPAKLRSRDPEWWADRSQTAAQDGLRDAERRVLRQSHAERNSDGTVGRLIDFDVKLIDFDVLYIIEYDTSAKPVIKFSRNGVPPPVSGVPSMHLQLPFHHLVNDVPSPFWENH